MEISLRYVATKTIEVRTVRDLAEAVGANLFGCVTVDWLPAPKNYVVYFAKTKDSKYHQLCHVSWTILDNPVSEDDENISPVVELAKDIYEWRIQEHHRKRKGLFTSQLSWHNKIVIGEKEILKFIQREEEDLKNEVVPPADTPLNDEGPDWLGGSETEDEFWEHTE